MRRLLAIMACVLPTVAEAEIITCTFTEPFVTTTYSTTQSTLTAKYETESREEVLTHISFQILGPGHFELWDADRRPVHRLDLSHKGSDGMSERRYPYEAHWTSKGVRGGCSSTHLPVKQPN